jgi:hypothetical protein
MLLVGLVLEELQKFGQAADEQAAEGRKER